MAASGWLDILRVAQGPKRKCKSCVASYHLAMESCEVSVLLNWDGGSRQNPVQIQGQEMQMLPLNERV